MLKAHGELPLRNDEKDLTLELASYIDAECSCIPTDQDPDRSVQERRSPSHDSLDDELDCEAPKTIPGYYNSCVPDRCIARPDSSMIPPAPEPDDVLLNRFRDEMSPSFPVSSISFVPFQSPPLLRRTSRQADIRQFVIVDSKATPADLEATRPLLWNAIKLVTSSSILAYIQGQLYRIIKMISDRMFLRSERSLDLLQGAYRQQLSRRRQD